MNSLSQSSVTLRLQNEFHNGYIVMRTCSSCFSIAQGPNSIYKGNSCGKNLLCLSFFLGVLEKNTLFFIHCITSPGSQLRKDRFSKTGMGWAVWYMPVDLLISHIWMSLVWSYKLLTGYQAFQQRACNTKLQFICN